MKIGQRFLERWRELLEDSGAAVHGRKTAKGHHRGFC